MFIFRRGAHEDYRYRDGSEAGGRWDSLQIEDGLGMVNAFLEKSKEYEAWINAGFAVFEPEIFEHLIDDEQQLEMGPFVELKKDHQMSAY